jgi:F-type H+-transporting ATPase subunit epsilon
MERSIQCSVITPERELYEGEAMYISLEAHDGQMGFLFNHAPIISELGIGEVQLRSDNNVEYLCVEGGVAELRENRLIILAEHAYARDDLDEESIRQKLEEIENRETGGPSAESTRIQQEKRRLKARLKVASR